MANSVTFIGEIADKQFKDWQNLNEDAFYLNIIGKFAMIHRANCWHLGKGENVISTGNSKVCSEDRKDLENWANKNDKEFQTCLDCIK